jgi:hypothetical protein
LSEKVGQRRVKWVGTRQKWGLGGKEKVEHKWCR